jgi:hypothetical protein
VPARSLLAAFAWICSAPALAATDVNLPVDFAQLNQQSTAPTAPSGAAAPQVGGLTDFIDSWYATIAHAKATQPEWSSPLVTTTSMLEQRYRFDIDVQHAGNGSDTTVLDGGKGLDLIVSDTEEIQVGNPPYDYYSAKKKKSDYVGFADWPLFRFKQRLASSPQDQGNYILSAWLQVQVPTGIEKTTNHAVVILPTIGFGKGFGPFDVQGSVGASIPTAYEGKLGTQVQANLAFQYHLLTYFWPQVEFNSTYYSNGTRNGLDQVFVTPGVVIGRLPITDHVKFTVGVGYQQAISPNYQAKPLIPAYDHAWIVTTRVGF